MKKLLTLLLVLGVLGPVPLSAAETPPPPETGAGAMILLHGPSGRVLAEHNADTPMLIASTTKLMTALAAVEAAEPAAEIVIRPEWAAVEGSSMYLRPGERYTLRELLEGLLLASGNDAALAVAAAADGDTERFVARMNRLAGELGMKDTHFANPHGLDAPDHRSTARDLARLMSAALEAPLLREIMGMKSCSVRGVAYINHNKLLWRCPGVNAGKTGYTMAAGRCLVSSCVRDGLELICVTLSDPEDWADHEALYDWAYSSFAVFSLRDDRPLARVPVISGSVESVGAAPAAGTELCLDRGARLSWQLALPPFVFAPVRPGETAGEALVLQNGEPLARLPLVWTETALLYAESRSMPWLPGGAEGDRLV